MILHIYKTEEELLTGFVSFFIGTAQKFIAKQGTFNIVLSGGNSPKKLYELLASPEYNKKIDWSKIFFFFGDERCVPEGDKENNAGMVQQTLFNPLQISPGKIFKIDTSFSPSPRIIKSKCGCRPLKCFDIT